MRKLLALPALVVAAALAGCSHPQPVYAPPPPAIDFQAVEQQGVHDGYEGARHDVETGRPPSFSAHPRYRNPPVPGPAWQAYRTGFRRGYEQFLHQGPPPGV